MRITPAEEAELIARAQGGDVEAFCALAANHQRSLYVLALKYSGNHHDAEDLTQEVMLNAFKSIRQFRGMSSFHTWLSRIMVNAFLNQKRKNDPLAGSQRQETTEEAFEASWPISRPIHTSERTVHNGLVAQQVLEMLEDIPSRQRLMFLMKHHEGMTCEEIAGTLGTSVGTVKKTLFRVVDRLRQHFAAPAAARAASKE
ncbi:MAG: sigma-70 family RNA polymerase sigma factor [Acidobacteria bacterium]|nr:sigma-70 family RNA polymerase sigma factor [Acidobacteriota bacterium]